MSLCNKARWPDHSSPGGGKLSQQTQQTNQPNQPPAANKNSWIWTVMAPQSIKSQEQDPLHHFPSSFFQLPAIPISISLLTQQKNSRPIKSRWSNLILDNQSPISKSRIIAGDVHQINLTIQIEQKYERQPCVRKSQGSKIYSNEMWCPVTGGSAPVWHLPRTSFETVIWFWTGNYLQESILHVGHWSRFMLPIPGR